MIYPLLNTVEYNGNYGPLKVQAHLKQAHFATNRSRDSFQAAPDVGDLPTMAEEASIGLPSEIGRLFGPHMESDPNELLLRAQTMLDNNIAREPHYRVESTLYARNLSVLKVGDSAKALTRTSEDRFPCLFVNEDWSCSRFHFDRVLKVVSDEVCGGRQP
jgi:hypothetical protein